MRTVDKAVAQTQTKLVVIPQQEMRHKWGNQLEDTVEETLKYRTPIGFSKNLRIQREKIEKSAIKYAICASIKRTSIDNETAKGRNGSSLGRTS